MIMTVLKNKICAHVCLVVLKAGLLTAEIRGLLCRKLLKGLNLQCMVWVPILCYLCLDICIFYKGGVRQCGIWTFIRVLPLGYRQQTYKTSECLLVNSNQCQYHYFKIKIAFLGPFDQNSKSQSGKQRNTETKEV